MIQKSDKKRLSVVSWMWAKVFEKKAGVSVDTGSKSMVWRRVVKEIRGYVQVNMAAI